jgi:hypothetical protein
MDEMVNWVTPFLLVVAGFYFNRRFSIFEQNTAHQVKEAARFQEARLKYLEDKLTGFLY